MIYNDFPGSLVGKIPPATAGDMSQIPGSGRSPGEVNGNPVQYSCWEMPWTEELGGLQSMGWQRARRDLATKQQMICMSMTGLLTVLPACR